VRRVIPVPSEVTGIVLIGMVPPGAADRLGGRVTQPLDMFKVRQVRGPFLKLPVHPSSVDSEQDLQGLVARLRVETPGIMVGADLFSGAGGLSLGLEQAGITTVFAVDKDRESAATHRHHFPGLTVDWDLSEPSVVERIGRLLAGLDVDVLAGGPPCQPFSKAVRPVRRGARQRLLPGPETVASDDGTGTTVRLRGHAVRHPAPKSPID